MRAVLGGDVDRRVLPIVPITFAYNASFSTFWIYVGIFAVKGLGWRPSEVGLVFLLSAPPAAVANYLSGRVSDRVGRKRPIIFSFLAAAAIMSALAILGHHAAAAFTLIVALGVVGAPAYSLDRVLVADLVHEDDAREAGYATVRVATNLGLFVGPPLAALVIHIGGWTWFLVAVAALGVAGAALTMAVLPATSAHAEHQPLIVGAVRRVVSDRPFLLLLLSTLLGFFVYCGFETVLPVIAVSAYGVAPTTWGFLVIIGPLLIVLFQLRLTHAALRIPPGARLAAAMLLMGLPFLSLIAWASVPIIGTMIVIFVVGEMLWVPTKQGVTAQLAPLHLRGSYFGALAAMTGPAWTIAPFIALRLREHAGVASVWILFATVAVLGAAAGVAATRAAGRRSIATPLDGSLAGHHRF